MNKIKYFINLRACDTYSYLPYELYQFLRIFHHNNKCSLLKLWEIANIMKKHVCPLLNFKKNKKKVNSCFIDLIIFFLIFQKK